MYLCSSSASTELDDHDLWNSESAQTDSADSTRQLPNINFVYTSISRLHEAFANTRCTVLAQIAPVQQLLGITTLIFTKVRFVLEKILFIVGMTP